MNYTKKSFTVAGTESSAINRYRANFDKVFRIEPDAHYAKMSPAELIRAGLAEAVEIQAGRMKPGRVRRFQVRDGVAERLTPEQAAFCERHSGTPCE